ncbi:histidine phosphatase family protein [Paenibacillus thalictri]|uniref:Histidine phosphatase family protein n=1 Tax=Paenibacillus thalictri TaxID=2527873 RepID=A0A4Q9DUU6_9BACL|nr:histidine phosphatase family protein [Paenibacillus thalictri]TBL80749.1 histidine phosphatase family protein [Paenibacillus thalictri]
MTIRIYVVRHAQPADQEPDYPGHPNAPLGRLGQAQAACAGEQFAKWGKLDAIYSSSLQRALQTAQAIYGRLAEPPPWRVWPALCETHRRGWPAMRQLELEGRYAAYAAEEAARKAEQGEHYPPLSQLGALFPGAQAHGELFEWPDVWHPQLEAETREKTYARARQVVDAVKKSHAGEDVRIALVCHAAFGSVFLNELLGCEPCDNNRFSFAHAAIARADLEDDGAVSLRMVNDVGHMPQAMVTEGVEL